MFLKFFFYKQLYNILSQILVLPETTKSLNILLIFSSSPRAFVSFIKPKTSSLSHLATISPNSHQKATFLLLVTPTLSSTYLQSCTCSSASRGYLSPLFHLISLPLTHQHPHSPSNSCNSYTTKPSIKFFQMYNLFHFELCLCHRQLVKPTLLNALTKQTKLSESLHVYT